MQNLAAELSITIDEEEAVSYAEILAETLDIVADIEDRPASSYHPEATTHERAPGYKPSKSEDMHNAWVRKCQVEGANSGPLTGMTVGIKDNISLAGVELTNGSQVMDGYVPTADATIVTRLLNAGATIVGKNNLWSFSSGAPEFGEVENPANPSYSIGHSSSGSAAAVSSGEVDIAIGSDQGGSIRMPASFAGIVGLKPTYGLIPYTGIFGSDPTLDHAGPLTQGVRETALATEVLAGRDGLDPRQPTEVPVHQYTEALAIDPSGATIGILEEGFQVDGSDAEVTTAVRERVDRLSEKGVEIDEVSVPMHKSAGQMSVVIALYGMGQLFRQHGLSPGTGGWHDAGAIKYLSRTLDRHSSDLPATVIHAILTSEYLRRNYSGAIYAKAKNLTMDLRAAYDDALDEVDALVMPTVPMKPPPHGTNMDLERMHETGPGFAETANTEPFNLSHHPAISIPCGTVDGVPVGAMFVGNHFDEMTLFTLAAAVEDLIMP